MHAFREKVREEQADTGGGRSPACPSINPPILPGPDIWFLCVCVCVYVSFLIYLFFVVHALRRRFKRKSPRPPSSIGRFFVVATKKSRLSVGWEENVYLRRRASRSDSSRHRMSSSRTIRRGKSAKEISKEYLSQASQKLTRALDVPDDGTGLVVHELDTDLSDTTARTGAAENAGHLDELDGLLRRLHFWICVGGFWRKRGTCGGDLAAFGGGEEKAEDRGS